MNINVLYIEDNHDNMRLVERALEARGYRFIWGESGRRGLELAAAERPGVILLDINLPDIDGYEVARRIRADKALLHTPIIAITANALKADAEKALAAGCDVYMAKPINIRELWARVEAFLPSPAGGGDLLTGDPD
ncbi:MAG TPA: response regulator [Anaerolineales bacterium]|nr:response regulator [Anaerolineales bacterium]